MKTALMLVDIQKDFCPGGALEVREGDQVVGPSNRLIKYCKERNLPIVLTRDWHPVNHMSFKARGGTWPTHCVADTQGAEFHSGLDIPGDALIVSKATASDQEEYSGFQGTNLAERLREQGVDHVLVAGLATDYCVKSTVLDALRNGFAVTVVADGIRAVNVQPDDGQQAIEEMRKQGAKFARLSEVIS